MIKKIINKIYWHEWAHPTLAYPWFLLQVLIVRRRYGHVLKRIQKRLSAGKRIRVLFHAEIPSKWKCQSIVDSMKKSTIFDPVVQVSEEGGKDSPQDVDIVFFQEPWDGKESVWKTSRSALCCYMPYSIETIAKAGRSEHFDYHHLANFHQLMFAQFQWCQAYADHSAAVMKPWERAGHMLGFGHSTLDVYTEVMGEDTHRQKGAVIFAPHFSFEYRGITPISNVGTFQWSGERVLEYAKSHPEMDWVFKPHPKLRDRLIEIGYWTQSQVDAYYAEWSKVARCCYDGDYAKLFVDSRAMITDCNSFLIEYMAVCHPLIRLIPEKCNVETCEQAKPLFDTFYTAHSQDEMLSWFEKVLERDEDPHRLARETESRKLGIFGNHAGRRIVEWLEGVCRS